MCKGEQPFKISMEGTKFVIVVKMDTITGCEADKNLILKEVELPLEYSSVNFDFTNIGSVLGTIVDSIGALALSFSQGIISSSLKEVIAAEVPSLICQNFALNNVSMEPIPVTPTQDK